ncbi:hypothetical protein ACFE04_030768 [Oxalis oulophora]
MKTTNNSSGGGADDRPRSTKNDRRRAHKKRKTCSRLTEFKASEFFIFMLSRSDRIGSSESQALNRMFKLMKQGKELALKTVESQAEAIKELTSMIEELQRLLAQQSVTFSAQNTRVELVEDHLINAFRAEMMAILARRGGSRSGSNQSGSNPASAFM